LNSIAIYRAQRRLIGPNTHHPEPPHHVTLSRREGSVSMGVEMLRYTQHDRVVKLAPHNYFVRPSRFRPQDSTEKRGMQAKHTHYPYKSVAQC